MSLSHDTLARSLADHLRGSDRMVWCDLQLGPAGSPRPDVYALFKSFAHPAPMAYECKVSMADFRADVTAGKWQTYLKFATGVYFACELGLLTKRDVPEHCGLMVLSGEKWRAAKKPVLQPVTIPQNALLKLVIDGVEREGPSHRARRYSESEAMARIERKFGSIAARTIRDRVAIDHEIANRRYQADRILSDAQRRADEIRKEATDLCAPLRVELCDLVGLPAGASSWQIKHEIDRLRTALATHPAHEALRRLTLSLQRALDRDGFKETEHTQDLAGEPEKVA